MEALQFGAGIKQQGFNLFAIGPPGIGKQTLIKQFLQQRAALEPPSADWCYVFNFSDPGKPKVLELPAGMGTKLEQALSRAILEIRVELRVIFDSEEYRSRREQLERQFKERQESALARLQERAKERDVGVVQTGAGLALTPLRNDAPLDNERFAALPEELRERLQAAMESVREELQALFRQFHEWAHEHSERVKALDREFATTAAHRVIGRVREPFRELPAVLAHLDEIERDIIDNADELRQEPAEGVEAAVRRAFRREESEGPVTRRYRVNVIVDRSGHRGAPVVHEVNPSYSNLLGRIEHETQFGTLVTNFTLIKPGALHRALGGFLILDVAEVLRQPLAWDAIKRVVKTREIRIESLGQAFGLVSTVTLEPATIPLGTTKLVLVGDRLVYYLLAAFDPDFLELFKVVVDFEETVERQPEHHRRYANLIAAVAGKEGLRPFDRGAVARVIDHAARYAGDAEKLSVHMRVIVDLLREADYWAGTAGRAVATAGDVQTAIDAQLRRASRVRDRLLEAIRRNDLLVATTGGSIGQVNGLSVFQVGEHVFGHPTRISARVRVGKGEVLDIEREVALGGPVHSKGVLILVGFLGARYASGAPLSLQATLVFEQSYGVVEGDSASLAELCALLSSLAEVPARQSIAMTGSVNQHGQVQSIGGVNEKIESFFDVCRDRGLTGEQAVMIPRSNVKNLMLRRDVVDAVEAGRFRIYAVADVDAAIELLTGKPAGVRDATGRFPDGSINALVEARLLGFAQTARAFLSDARAGREGGR